MVGYSAICLGISWGSAVYGDLTFWSRQVVSHSNARERHVPYPCLDIHHPTRYLSVLFPCSQPAIRTPPPHFIPPWYYKLGFDCHSRWLTAFSLRDLVETNWQAHKHMSCIRFDGVSRGVHGYVRPAPTAPVYPTFALPQAYSDDGCGLLYYHTGMGI